jgi:hypothetical protein
MSDNNGLREKIDQAKRRLPLPELMAQVGLGDRAKKTAHCPFHDDEHKSFSVFQGKGGFWFWKCHAGCEDGDEIMFLAKLKELSPTQAMKLYLEMAGFPACAFPKSHEYPKPHESPGSPGSPGSPECPGCPGYPGSPVSNGQGLEEELKGLAASNACTQRNTARKRRWQLLRDLRAVEVRLRRELVSAELMLALYEWYRLSQPFLDPAKRPDYYLAAFLAELRKVRIPAGEGETIKKAVDRVRKFALSELPVVPGERDVPESWRRVLALHREISARCANNTYFLSCRDAAKAFPGLSHQTAYNINLILAQLGAIKIVRTGDARPNGKASEFRYLLAQTDTEGQGDDEEDEELEL